MSRSNPTQNTRNPSTRWLEWHGSKGNLNYWDKEAKKKVVVEIPFTFLLLDEVATVKGFHEPSQSGVFANEVRDTRQETLLVKSFEGGEIASGLYANIRDRVKAHGGYFQSSCYIAYKDGDTLKIGNIGWNGAALQAWSEFKKHTNGLYESAVTLAGFEDRTKGATKYRIPKFVLKPVGAETNEQAVKLDAELQTFFKEYFGRTRTEQAAKPAVVEPPASAASMGVSDVGGGGSDSNYGDSAPFPEESEDLPFITRMSIW